MEDRSYKKGTTVSTDDITVHQLYTDDELAVPAIVLKLVSNRDDSAAIRLRVPEPTAQRVGFHPEFENDAWEITDDGLLFETTLEPETEITTLYAVETEDETAVGEAMDTLEIEDVEAVAGEAASSESGESEATEDGVADPDETLVDVSETAAKEDTEAEIDPEQDLIDLDEGEKAELATDFDLGVDEIDTEVALKETADNADDEEFDDLSAATNGDPMDEPETPEPTEQSTEHEEKSAVDAEDVSERPATGESETPGDSSEDTSGEAAEPSPVAQSDGASGIEAGATGGSGGESLSEYSTEALVEEVTQRAGSEGLSAAEQEQLATLGEDGDSRGAVRDAQIDNLQSRVSDVEAFTDTLEDVLEQHGPPAAVLAEYDERLTSIESELETVSDEVIDTTETVATMQPKVSDLESGLEAVESDIDAVDEDIRETRDELDAVQTDVDEVAEGQESLESDVKTLQEWRKKITGALEAFTGE